MSTTITTFRQYISGDVPGCPSFVLDKYILETLIKFCEETMLLKMDADDISVLEDTAEYDVTFGSNEYSAISLDKAYLGDGSDDDTRVEITTKRKLDKSGLNWDVQTVGGDITHVYLTMNGKVRVYPIPESDLSDSLRLPDVVVKPTRDATEIEDIVYNDHIETIRDGTLWKVLSLRGRQWTDLQAAFDHRAAFFMGAANAGALARKGKNELDMTVSYAGSSMF